MALRASLCYRVGDVGLRSRALERGTADGPERAGISEFRLLRFVLLETVGKLIRLGEDLLKAPGHQRRYFGLAAMA